MENYCNWVLFAFLARKGPSDPAPVGQQCIRRISNKLYKSHLLFRYFYFRMKMLVQSKLRSTFVQVFLLTVSMYHQATKIRFNQN